MHFHIATIILKRNFKINALLVRNCRQAFHSIEYHLNLLLVRTFRICYTDQIVNRILSVHVSGGGYGDRIIGTA